MGCSIGNEYNDPNYESYFDLEEILKQNHGLFDIKIKIAIRDSEGLSLAYTPGVATPCLEIQKDLSRGYELTNKANSILVLTDGSNFFSQEEKKCSLIKTEIQGKKWNNNAAMIYLESFTAYYKCSTNIDAYPMILDLELIKDAETLLDTVNAVSLSFSGVELFGVCPKRLEEFKSLFEKLGKKPEYSFIDGNKKIKIDEILDSKNTELTGNAIFSAIWRVALDCHIFGDLDKIVNHIIEQIKNDKIDLTKGEDFETDLTQVVEKVVDFIFSEKLENHSYDKYNWRKLGLNKNYILKKLEYFLCYGNKA